MDKLIRINNVTDATGFTRSWIYVLVREGKFPAPVKVGKRAVRWRQSEVAQWIESQVQS